MKNLLTVREAVESDVKKIHELLTIYSEKAIVLARSEEDIRFYLGNFLVAEVGGVVRVKFYIEPTGRVVIGEVLRSPDEQLTKEVLRAIRASKGKWTPRKVDGVPQRTAYEFHCNYVNDGY